jgi:predicted O-methyltransferase YrrM
MPTPLRDTFERNFLRVSRDLEKLCDTFVIRGVPEAYKGIWLPKNEIRAWAVPRRSGEFLRSLALTRRAKIVLELGTSFGFSTLWLADAMRHTKGKVYTVELTKPKIEAARTYFERAHVAKHIEQIEGSCFDVLRRWNRKLDFVFMDADKMNYYKYMKLLEPHLNPGAVVVADNATDFKHLMRDYLRYVSSSPRYHSYLLDIDNGLMITNKL